jgi:hypothetical protein
VHQTKLDTPQKLLILSILVTRHEHADSLVVSTFTSRSAYFHLVRLLWC